MAAQGDAGGKADEMKEIPVLFNGAMVRAILDDRKTQTRRIVKGACNLPHEGKLLGEWGLSKPPARWDGVKPPWRWMSKKPIRVGDWFEQAQTDVDDYVSRPVRSPLGMPGDRLWVRETFISMPACAETGRRAHAIYRADGGFSDGYKWSPSIYMPRWAARLFLDVLDVRIERLQDISEEDARAEGADRNEGKWVDEDGRTRSSYRLAFQRLWISLYGAESWAANPWVWVTEFERKRDASDESHRIDSLEASP